MEGNIVDGLKLVGAGLAAIGMNGAAIGVGRIFASYIEAAMRNPSAAPQQTGNLFVGMALSEAMGIFSLVIALVILFAM